MNSEIFELRRYLLLSREGRERSPYRDKFGPFLKDVQHLFSLRMVAESRYLNNRWLAIRSDAALPITWEQVDNEFSSNVKSPRAGLETMLARDVASVLSRILGDIRKQLLRTRRCVPVAQVRQLDSGCLRWLLRQPGRNVPEKAGPRQKVLGVVRSENYNTLENRILKDFMVRVRSLTDIWLNEFKPVKFQDEVHRLTVECVDYLNKLCSRGLALEAFQSVASVQEMPTPNYVLQQDSCYSKIWVAYRSVIHWYRLLESLWGRRDDIAGKMAMLAERAPRLKQNLYLSEVWVNPIRENVDFFEPIIFEETEIYSESHVSGFVPIQDPIEESLFASDNQPIQTVLFPTEYMPQVQNNSSGPLRVLDLMGPMLNDGLLIADPEVHPNAHPRLIDVRHPYVDFYNEEEFLVSNRMWWLCNAYEKHDDTYLKDYFLQLKARIQGERWVILVPDNWDADWQEKVLEAASAAFMYDRSRVVLLWRTIAYTLGIPKSLRTGRMSCLRADRKTAWADFEYDGADKRPIRRSFNLHWDDFSVPPLTAVRSNSSPFLLPFSANAEVDAVSEIAIRGATLFDEARQLGIFLYYDELEGLHLLVQGTDEELSFVTLIPPNKRFPGGISTLGQKNSETYLKEGEETLHLWLQVNDRETGDNESELLSYTAQFETKIRKNWSLPLQAEASPGQGLISIHFRLPFENKQRTLRLKDMRYLKKLDVNEKSKYPLEHATVAYVEEHIDRSFPPASSRVYADSDLWRTPIEKRRRCPEYYVNAYIQGARRELPPAGTFALARDLYPAGRELPAGVSPLERLCRKNVFGNVAEHECPYGLSEADAHKLFVRLKHDLAKVEPGTDVWCDIIRLIAWTYQSETPLFSEAKRQCLDRMKETIQNRGSGVNPQEFTLCANLCVKPAEWRECLEYIVSALNHPDYVNRYEYCRLFYNLLQFHPEFLEKTGLWKRKPILRRIIKDLCSLYPSVFSNLGSNIISKYQGYVLKSILYLLRCRKYDGKHFLTAEYDRELRAYVLSELMHKGAVDSKQKLLDTLLDYIDGKGTIDGLPTN